MRAYRGRPAVGAATAGSTPGAFTGRQRPAPGSGLVTFVAAAVTLLALASPALAVVDVNKEFSPINIFPAETSTLTIRLFNSALVTADNTAFTDTLPATVTATSIVGNSCGGIVSITPNTQVSLSGGTIPAGDGSTSGTCSVSVIVTSNTPGTYVNTIPVGGVTTSNQGSNPLAANATLTVATVLNLTGSKTASPLTIHITGSSLLTITLNNPNIGALTNASFTDNLPVPLVIDNPVVTGGTCGATFTDGGGGSLDPGDTSFRVTGGTIPANGSCTVTVRVTVDPARETVAQNGNVTNTILSGAVTTAQGATNASAFSRNIQVQTGAATSKSFAPSTIFLNGTSTLTLTLLNYNPNPISPADFTDAMPAGITVVGPVSTTCGGSVSFTAGEVQLTGGTIPPAPNPNASSAGSCTVTATVRGDGSGGLVNAVPAGLFGTINYTGTSATLTVLASPVTVSKAFSPSSVVQTGSTTLTITLANASGLNAAITSFVDNLTTLGSGFTVAASPAATTTCGGTLNAAPGATSVSMTGGSIPAGGNCTITVPVAVGPTAPNGTRTNTVAAGGLVTDQGNNQNPATANLTVSRAAGVSKAFSPTSVIPGGISRLTITITHTNGAVAFSNMGITDPLPAGHSIAATPNLFNNCGGSVTANPGDTSIVLTGGSLGLGATSCQIGVDVQTPATTGSSTNTIPANSLSTAEGVTYNTTASATLTRQAGQVTLNKAFVPVVSNGGAPVTVQVTIANNQPGAVNLTNVGFSDVLPPNVEVHTSPNPSFTGSGCSLGVVTAVPQTNQFSLSGASINANATCTVSLNVTAFFDGNHINDLPVGAITSAQGITNNNSPSATLTVLRNINIGKYFGPNPMEAGGTGTLTLRLYNTNTVTRTLTTSPPDAAGVIDNLPAGLTVAGAASTDCTGAAVVAPIGGNTVTVNGGTLAAGAACNVNVPVTAAAGSFANTIPANSVNTVEGSTNPDSASSTLTVVAKPTIAKAFSPASIPAGSTSTITFTLSNPNPSSRLPGGLTGASFTDTLANMAITANQNAGGSCVGASSNGFTTGQTALSFSGLTIPAGSPGTCTVTVVVTSSTVGVWPNQTSGVLTAQTQTVGTPSNEATLTVVGDRPTISKSFTPASILGGGTSTLTFVLGNTNPVAATLASPAFTDVFPTTPGAMTLADTTTTNTCGGTIQDSGGGALGVGDIGIRYINGSIPANGNCTISVNVTAGVPGTYANASSVVTSTNSGSSLTGASADLEVLAQADLSVAKIVSNPTPPVGSTVTFTVSLANAGPAPATGVVVTDTLPAGYVFVSATPSQGTFNSLTGVWDVGTVGVGAIATLAVQMTVNLTGPYGTNTAEVTAADLNDPDSTPNNNDPAEDDQASVTPVPAPVADLSVTKIVDNAAPLVGATITFTVTVSNAGPSGASGVVVADPLPAGFTFASATPSQGSYNSGTGQWTVGALAVSASATLDLGVTVNPAGPYTNTAQVAASDQLDLDSTPNNSNPAEDDQASVTPTPVPVADVTTTVTMPPTADAGSTVNGTVTFGNNGPSTAAGVGYTLQLTSGTADVTITGLPGGASFTYDQPTGVVTLIGMPGSLASGASLSLTVSYTAPPTGTVTVTSGISTTTDQGANLAPDSAADDTVITEVADVTTTVTMPVNADAGSTVTGTVTYSNNGPSTAAGVGYTLQLTPGTADVAITGLPGGASFSYDQPSGVVTLTGMPGTLASGASLSLTVSYTAPPTGTVTVTSGISTTTDQGANLAPDTAADDTTVGEVADVFTTVDMPATANAGSTVTGSVTFGNNGPSTAAGVGYTLQLTPGTADVAISGLPGGASFSYDQPSGVVTLTGMPGSLASGESLAVTVSYTAPDPGTVTVTSGISTTTNEAGQTANNTASDPTVIALAGADLALVKEADPQRAPVGGHITFTLRLRNNGPVLATGVTVTDTLPAGVSVTGASPECTPAGGTVTCSLASLAVGAETAFTITVTGSAVGDLTNTAVADANESDPEPANNDSDADIAFDEIAPIPILDPAHLALLAALIALAGALVVRRAVG